MALLEVDNSNSPYLANLELASRFFQDVSLPVAGFAEKSGIFYCNRKFTIAFPEIDFKKLSHFPSYSALKANPGMLFSTLGKNFSNRLYKVLWHDDEAKALFIEFSPSAKSYAGRTSFSLPDLGENPFAEIMGSLREVLFFADKDGLIQYISPAWEALSGYTVKETTGKSYTSFIEPENIDAMQRVIGFYSHSDKPFFREEFRLLTRNGHSLWVELSAVIRKDTAGKISGTYGVLYDINDRKKSEKRLQESEVRYRLISENISDLVILINADEQVKFLSASALQFFGLPDEELSSFMLVPRLYHADIAGFRALLKAVLTATRAQHGNFRFASSGDEFIWLSCSAVLYSGSLQDEKLILLSCRDISFQKKAEEEMLDNLEKERELNRLKSDFINMASHEFRTPLTAMKSSIDLLESYSDSSSGDMGVRIRKHTQRIKAQINRLTTLISDILMLGRMETGGVHYRPERTDMLKIIDDVEREQSLQRADNRSLKILTEGNQRSVFCDPVVISHVVGNLLSNAFKYSEGKPDPIVKLHFFEEKVELSVTDFGVGIPDEDQGLLFNSFFRGQNVLNIPGTGLGLIIIKQFVELHKGNIHFKSKIGEGTTFYITLPYE